MNQRVGPGVTPLLAACQQGHAHLANYLLDNGADPAARTEDGESVLFTATRAGLDVVISRLLDGGADPNGQSELGATSLMVATKASTTELLVEAGAATNLVMHDGTDALMCAAQEGASEVLALLLERGGDPTRSNQKGVTALMLAAMGGHSECARASSCRGVEASSCRDRRHGLVTR